MTKFSDDVAADLEARGFAEVGSVGDQFTRYTAGTTAVYVYRDKFEVWDLDTGDLPHDQIGSGRSVKALDRFLIDKMDHIVATAETGPVLVRLELGDATWVSVFSSAERGQRAVASFLENSPMRDDLPWDAYPGWDRVWEYLKDRGDATIWFTELYPVDSGSFVDIDGP